MLLPGRNLTGCFKAPLAYDEETVYGTGLLQFVPRLSGRHCFQTYRGTSGGDAEDLVERRTNLGAESKVPLNPSPQQP